MVEAASVAEAGEEGEGGGKALDLSTAGTRPVCHWGPKGHAGATSELWLVRGMVGAAFSKWTLWSNDMIPY